MVKHTYSCLDYCVERIHSENFKQLHIYSLSAIRSQGAAAGGAVVRSDLVE